MAGVLQPATTCSNSSRDRPNTPAASLLLLRIPWHRSFPTFWSQHPRT